MRAPLQVMQLVLSLEIGGTERLVYDIVHRIDKNRVNSVICCLDTLGDFGENLRQEGYLPYTFSRKPGIDTRIISQLKTVIQQEHVDVIHAHQYTPYFYGLMATIFCKFSPFAKAPRLVFTEHGRFYPEKKNLKRILINPFLSLCTDEIVTISESTRQALITYENFPANRIQVVYNGIDFDRFSQTTDIVAKKQVLGLPCDSNVIGIVARLDPIKNHAMLLRAFKKVLEHMPETSLLVVGSGPELLPLQALAESLGIHKRTFFLGARNDIPEVLQVFDIFALSSFSEGTSVTLLEAMGAGLPIVATKVGGNPEVIQDQETGYLVQSDNHSEMAKMLITLLQQRETRQKMGDAGRKRAYSMFTLDKMINTYTELYLKVAK